MGDRSVQPDLAVFGAFASGNAERWRLAVGGRIVHFLYEEGIITGVTVSPRGMVYIDIDFPSVPELCKSLSTEYLGVFTSMTLPSLSPETLAAITSEGSRTLEAEQARQARERFEQEEMAKVSTGEDDGWWEEETAQELNDEASPEPRELLRLKEKFLVMESFHHSSSTRLLSILQQLEKERCLSHEEVGWLERHHYTGPLAFHFELAFRTSGDPWQAVKACRYWRDAGKPERAVGLSEAVTRAPSFDGLAARLRAAILTTRGGALRDLGRLDEAENCGLTAERTNPDSHYPYNLLGAVYIQMGKPHKGEFYFGLAFEKGASSEAAVSSMKSALRLAEPEARRRSAEYLLRRDPIKNRWAKSYLYRTSVRR
jgi:tetratricopeptide (TPR) repeat protein